MRVRDCGVAIRTQRLGGIVSQLLLEGRAERRGKTWRVVDVDDLIQ